MFECSANHIPIFRNRVNFAKGYHDEITLCPRVLPIWNWQDESFQTSHWWRSQTCFYSPEAENQVYMYRLIENKESNIKIEIPIQAKQILVKINFDSVPLRLLLLVVIYRSDKDSYNYTANNSE